MACNWGKCPKGRGSLLADVAFEVDGQPAGAHLPDEKDDAGPKAAPQLKVRTRGYMFHASGQVYTRTNWSFSRVLPCTSCLQRLQLLLKSKVCVEVTPAGRGGSSGGSGGGSSSALLLGAGAHELRLRVTTPDTYVLLSHLIWF